MSHIGLHRNDTYGLVVLFQASGYADCRAGSSKGRYYVSNPSISLLPDFLGGCKIMRLPVVFIIELVRHEIAIWKLARQFIDLFNGTVRS